MWPRLLDFGLNGNLFHAQLCAGFGKFDFFHKAEFARFAIDEYGAHNLTVHPSHGGFIDSCRAAAANHAHIAGFAFGAEGEAHGHVAGNRCVSFGGFLVKLHILCGRDGGEGEQRGGSQRKFMGNPYVSV